jgi:VWFA-related protein
MGVRLQLCLIAALVLCAANSASQTATSPTVEAQPPLTVTTRLVFVPVMVRTQSGDLIHALSAADFELLDNGVSQKISLEPSSPQPLSILVLMQTGGTAAREFDYYSKLPTMLDYIAGSSPYQVSLITFDSQPEDQWYFTSHIDDLKDAFLHPQHGDNGAAIFDALRFGISQLAQRPADTRRILLLLSQPQDDGSKGHAEEIVRMLGEDNITIFSLTFSPEKTWLKDQFTKPRAAQKPYQLSPALPPVLNTFDLMTPLREAINAMRTNAASETASLAGGESLPFDDQKSLESQLALVANYIPNHYVLTFHPTSNRDGFHKLEVRVRNHPEFAISARTSYWSTASEAR